MMEAADFNFNVEDRAAKARKLLTKLRDSAPAELRLRLHRFKANTPRVHGRLLDELIDERSSGDNVAGAGAGLGTLA